MSKRNELKDIIHRADLIHNNAYDYSLLGDHKSMHDYVNIICQKHGIFSLSLHSHINKKRGCKYCAIERATDTKEDFVRKANKIHDNKYNYDKTIYINSKTKVIITCPIHGDFLQKPMDHINSKQGCPTCSESKGEREIRIILKKLNINFISEYKFCDLRYVNCLFFDFYLPDFNCCIEFDGEQHYAPFDIFGGEKSFLIIKERDEMKNQYCIDNNMKLLRISYLDKHIERTIKNFIFLKENKIIKFSNFK